MDAARRLADVDKVEGRRSPAPVVDDETRLSRDVEARASNGDDRSSSPITEGLRAAAAAVCRPGVGGIPLDDKEDLQRREPTNDGIDSVQ